jgi:hypothetical protein
VLSYFIQEILAVTCGSITECVEWIANLQRQTPAIGQKVEAQNYKADEFGFGKSH